MVKRKQFNGGAQKPISFAITITVDEYEVESNGKIEHAKGSAIWSFLDGYCRVELVIKNSTFSALNFQVRHNSDQWLGNHMQKQGLDDSQVTYLEQLFRETALS